MDAPPVQYVTTSDGYNIAFAVSGEGAPLLLMPFHHNHMQRTWGRPGWQTDLAKHFRVIYYDGRGQGLSTRGLPDTTIAEDFRRDLEAVIERVGHERFVLAGYGGFSHVAVRYAVDHPERVHALIAFCTCATFSAWPLAAMLDLARENWDLFLQMELPRHLSPEISDRLLDFFKQASTKDDYVATMRAFSTSDIGDLLPRLRVPTLLLHSQMTHWLSPEEGAKVAATIANARLVFTGGDLDPDYVDGVPAIVDFLQDVLSREGSGTDRQGALSVALSSRQRDVLRLIAEGKTNREIADALVLSERTVERHVADVYAKLDIRNRAEAVGFARDHATVVGALPGGLSQREVEVLRLIAAGRSNPQIADELVISLNTVQRHVSNIFAKTGLANRTEAAIYARDRGLL